MLIRKVAVPLINEKILQQAQHCYIVTAGITDAGFDFIRTRIPSTCKIDLVTGLNEATSPGVMTRILSHYEGRISLRIFTRNHVHANAYIFDLPFRKAVAFVGSGSLSLEGLKDQEEIFWKVSDPKEIESLLSWFTGFYEFGIPLTEAFVKEYEQVYKALKLNELHAKRELRGVYDGLNADMELVKFKNQYFKREDFESLRTNSGQHFEDAAASTDAVLIKINKLQELVEVELGRLGFYALKLSSDTSRAEVNSTMSVGYGKNVSGYSPGWVTVQFCIARTGFNILLTTNGDDESASIRLKFRDQLQEPEFRKKFFETLGGLAGYTLEAGANRKNVEYFKQDSLLVEFFQSDSDMLLPMTIGRSFSPGDPGISNDQIAGTIVNEFKKLKGVYQLLSAIG